MLLISCTRFLLLLLLLLLLHLEDSDEVAHTQAVGEACLRLVLFTSPLLGFERLHVCLMAAPVPPLCLLFFFFSFFPSAFSSRLQEYLLWALLFISGDTGGGRLPKISGNILPPHPLSASGYIRQIKMLIHVFFPSFLLTLCVFQLPGGSAQV